MLIGPALGGGIYIRETGEDGRIRLGVLQRKETRRQEHVRHRPRRLCHGHSLPLRGYCPDGLVDLDVALVDFSL